MGAVKKGISKGLELESTKVRREKGIAENVSSRNPPTQSNHNIENGSPFNFDAAQRKSAQHSFLTTEAN